MSSNPDFDAVFARLKAILEPYASSLTVDKDGPDDFSLNGPYSARFKRPLFFGAVQARKNYISYHLMPVYMFPELLDSISPALRKRMQGKSCFNFKAVDESLLAELAELTARGFTRFQTTGQEQASA